MCILPKFFVHCIKILFYFNFLNLLVRFNGSIYIFRFKKMENKYWNGKVSDKCSQSKIKSRLIPNESLKKFLKNLEFSAMKNIFNKISTLG